MLVRTRDRHARRLISTTAGEVDIHYSGPTGGAGDLPGVLVFGYAGSGLRQLEKHCKLYNSLGYRTLSCVPPQEFLFHYDVPQLVQLSRSVLEAAEEKQMLSFVIHCVSNNGATLYQHLTQELSCPEYDHLQVKGAVFDSGPGPQTLLPRPALFSKLRRDKSEARPPGKLFLQTAYLSVNQANKLSLRDNMRMMVRQWRDLEPDPSVSWVGHHLKYQDWGPWPLLFIYSKADPLIPWKFLSGLVEEIKARDSGRVVKELCLDKSGHVAHLKTHPDLYTQTVTQFLQSL